MSTFLDIRNFIIFRSYSKNPISANIYVSRTFEFFGFGSFWARNVPGKFRDLSERKVDIFLKIPDFPWKCLFFSIFERTVTLWWTRVIPKTLYLEISTFHELSFFGWFWIFSSPESSKKVPRCERTKGRHFHGFLEKCLPFVRSHRRTFLELSRLEKTQNPPKMKVHET